MMRPLNLLSLSATVAFLAFGPQARAQTTDHSRYIEVTVSDTLHVTPDVVEFTLTLRSDMVGYEVAYDSENYGTENPDYQAEMKKREEEMKLKMKMTEKRFTELLSKEKIQYTRADNAPIFDVYPGDVHESRIKSFVLKFSSFEKMAQFKEKIPEDIKYDGNLTSLSCSKYAQLEEKLLEKLMIKAKKQAEKLATLSNVKLGHLEQFSDNVGSDLVKGIEQLLTSFMNKYEREKFFDVFKNMNLSKTVRVRYTIE